VGGRLTEAAAAAWAIPARLFLLKDVPSPGICLSKPTTLGGQREAECVNAIPQS